mmetsp:Transcript_1158/g.2139  ORF Transcript_1158/g.2139 Transcript_1158/m.2139 type:complete len:84 (-) Transcript_1158:287-538(-)
MTLGSKQYGWALLSEIVGGKECEHYYKYLKYLASEAVRAMQQNPSNLECGLTALRLCGIRQGSTGGNPERSRCWNRGRSSLDC